MDLFKNTHFGQHLPMKKNNIAKVRKRAGLTQAELAEMIGTTDRQLGKLERGERRLSDVWLEPLSVALNCTYAELLGESEVPIIGYVGAGDEVYYFDDYAKGDGIDTVSRPPMSYSGTAIALEIRGSSMMPRYREGWCVIYSRESPWDIDQDIINEDCVVRLPDGRTYLKEVIRGSQKGRFHLISVNARPIENVEIEWAAPVLAVVRK